MLCKEEKKNALAIFLLHRQSQIHSISKPNLLKITTIIPKTCDLNRRN